MLSSSELDSDKEGISQSSSFDTLIFAGWDKDCSEKVHFCEVWRLFYYFYFKVNHNLPKENFSFFSSSPLFSSVGPAPFFSNIDVPELTGMLVSLREEVPGVSKIGFGIDFTLCTGSPPVVILASFSSSKSTLLTKTFAFFLLLAMPSKPLRVFIRGNSRPDLALYVGRNPVTPKCDIVASLLNGSANATDGGTRKLESRLVGSIQLSLAFLRKSRKTCVKKWGRCLY